MENKTVLTLIERAERNGVAKAYSYRGEYGEKQHVEKYRVTCEGNNWKLYHYETLTATVTDGVGTVVYGESKSDVDSIETFLYELIGCVPEMHFYPSKDTFQVVSDGRVAIGNGYVSLVNGRQVVEF